MKKQSTKWILLSLILLLALFAGGCQSLFFPRNVPIVLREDITSKSQSPKKISIQSYHIICPGTVHDITNSGNALILFNTVNSEAAFNIDSYDMDTQQLSPFISSDKRELSALYDTNDTGIYYVEETVDPLTGNASSQLLWTDINKDITRIISLPEENVVKYFGIGESDQVVYGNNNNEIIIADNQGNRMVYTTLQNFNILSVDYMKNTSSLVFIAYDPMKEEKTNLYSAEIKADSFELLPKLVEENVVSFDINDLNNQLVFIKNAGANKSIGTWPSNTANSTMVATGNFGTARYTPNGEKIIYTQYSPNFDSQSLSIWIMDTNGNQPLQITAPLKLTSQVMCHPFKPILYFSVEKNTEDLTSIQDPSLYQTYQVIYSIQ